MWCLIGIQPIAQVPPLQLAVAMPSAPLASPQAFGIIAWLPPVVWLPPVAAPVTEVTELLVGAEPLAVAASAIPPPHNTSTAAASATTTEAAVDLIASHLSFCCHGRCSPAAAVRSGPVPVSRGSEPAQLCRILEVFYYSA
jgi:hypothetical protein